MHVMQYVSFQCIILNQLRQATNNEEVDNAEIYKDKQKMTMYAKQVDSKDGFMRSQYEIIYFIIHFNFGGLVVLTTKQDQQIALKNEVV